MPNEQRIPKVMMILGSGLVLEIFSIPITTTLILKILKLVSRNTLVHSLYNANTPSELEILMISELPLLPS